MNFEFLLSQISSQLKICLHSNRLHSDCPNCGKSHKCGQTHFCFNKFGFRCWVCGFQGNLFELSKFLNIKIENQNFQPIFKKVKVKKQYKPNWISNPKKYLENYVSNKDRFYFWKKYKPISNHSIEKYYLGLGKLSDCKCKHLRLIYPVFENETIIGFRGRSFECHCEKWLQSYKSKVILFNSNEFRLNQYIILVENPIDCILINEQFQDLDINSISSSSGAGIFKTEWFDKVCSYKPKLVKIWMDNDIAGNPNKKAFLLAREEREENIRKLKEQFPDRNFSTKLPIPNSRKIANEFLRRGIKVLLHEWPEGTPYHYDIGQMVIDNMEVEEECRF